MTLYFRDQFYHVEIDSANREDFTTTTSSNFGIRLSLPSREYTNICLLQASIPKTYYSFTATSNTFTVVENLDPRLITIPPGNYTSTELVAKLITLLNSGSRPAGWTYNIVINSTTLKMEFTLTGSSIVSVSFVFGNYYPSIDVNNGVSLSLGFDADEVYDFAVDGSGLSATLTSVNVIGINPINILYISTDAVSRAQNSTLAFITGIENVPQGNTIQYVNQSGIEEYSRLFDSDVSQYFHFTIQDRWGNIVDLNGQEVQFELLLYKKNDVDELQRAELIRIKQIREEAGRLAIPSVARRVEENTFGTALGGR